jgi:hypothetical protein
VARDADVAEDEDSSSETMTTRANNCVQATPDCALLFTLALVSGAPDAER